MGNTHPCIGGKSLGTVYKLEPLATGPVDPRILPTVNTVLRIPIWKVGWHGNPRWTTQDWVRYPIVDGPQADLLAEHNLSWMLTNTAGGRALPLEPVRDERDTTRNLDLVRTILYDAMRRNSNLCGPRIITDCSPSHDVALIVPFGDPTLNKPCRRIYALLGGAPTPRRSAVPRRRIHTSSQMARSR